MSQIVKLIIRLFSISVGYLIACATAASSYLFLSGLIRPEDFEKYGDVEMIITMLITVPSLTFIFGKIGFFAFSLLVLIFEIRRIKDWLFHLIAGAIVAASSAVVYSEPTFEFKSASLYVVSAMIGGFFYWLFVGQRAGNWRE